MSNIYELHIVTQTQIYRKTVCETAVMAATWYCYFFNVYRYPVAKDKQKYAYGSGSAV